MRPKGIDWSAERVVYWTAAVAPHVALAIWLVGLAVFGYRVATTPPSEPAPAPTTGEIVFTTATVTIGGAMLWWEVTLPLIVVPFIARCWLRRRAIRRMDAHDCAERR